MRRQVDKLFVPYSKQPRICPPDSTEKPASDIWAADTSPEVQPVPEAQSHHSPAGPWLIWFLHCRCAAAPLNRLNSSRLRALSANWNNHAGGEPMSPNMRKELGQFPQEQGVFIATTGNQLNVLRESQAFATFIWWIPQKAHKYMLDFITPLGNWIITGKHWSEASYASQPLTILPEDCGEVFRYLASNPVCHIGVTGCVVLQLRYNSGICTI